MESIMHYLPFFEHSPVATAILTADTLNLQLANPAMLKLLERDDSVIGRPLYDVLPEIKQQQYPEIIEHVLSTGTYHLESGSKFLVNNQGRYETKYVDYSYTPIQGEDNKPMAILVLATDVSESELAKQTVEECDRNLRSLVMSAPVPMCVFKGDNLNVEIVNDQMLELWRDKKEIRLQTLQHVFHSEVTFTERVDDISYSYTPLKDGLGNICGVALIGDKILFDTSEM